MIAVTFINLLAVFLAFLSRAQKFRYCFGLSIIILICFYSIRFNYGNDYPAYLNMFKTINSYATVTYSTDTYDIERGWIFLNRVFAPLGFFSLVIFITIFQFGTIYWLIKKYVHRNYRFIALFFYLFSSGLMLTMLSMMRQCFAINLILFSIPFILNRKFWISLPIILLAAQFHQSAYMMLILPFTIYLQKLDYKTYRIIFLALFALLFLMSDFLHNTIGNIIESYFGKYSIYFEENQRLSLGSGLGFIFNIIFFCLLVISDKQFNNTQSWFIKMSALSYMFIPLGFITPSIGRIGTYFSVMSPIGITPVLKNIKKNLIILLLSILYILITLYGYFGFFYSEIFHSGFFEYHTIFESLWQ